MAPFFLAGMRMKVQKKKEGIYAAQLFASFPWKTTICLQAKDPAPGTQGAYSTSADSGLCWCEHTIFFVFIVWLPKAGHPLLGGGGHHFRPAHNIHQPSPFPKKTGINNLGQKKFTLQVDFRVQLTYPYMYLRISRRREPKFLIYNIYNILHIIIYILRV